MSELFFISVILVGIWYWWDTQRCNELALSSCLRKCKAAGLQLLDATVTRQRTWLRRDSNGRLQICRLYSFEYSCDTPLDFGQREYAYIVLTGKQVVELNIPQLDTGANANAKVIH